ncbi:MAG: S8 family peptidase [Pseudomonadota bacterium]
MTEGTQGEDFRKNLDETIIAIPLLEAMQRLEETGKASPLDIIIDLNIMYAASQEDWRALDSARADAKALVDRAVKECPPGLYNEDLNGLDEQKSEYAYQHIFARLHCDQIRYLARLIDKKARETSEKRADSETTLAVNVRRYRPIYKLWLDSEIEGQMWESVRTIKADASQISFGARGKGICWAVLDSGVEGSHIHFDQYHNLRVSDPLRHMDFTTTPAKALAPGELPTDDNGHGTHVAGIIAGSFKAQDSQQGSATAALSGNATAVFRSRDPDGQTKHETGEVWDVSGVAPRCNILSLKVLDKDGKGKESNIIAALGYIDKLNASSRWPLIHGVNLSVGYEFKADWFGCGQSPLCIEVDRIVRSGLPVVAAAGNTGYGKLRLLDGAVFRSGLPLSINDPGNAALAITVGSTHREHPHTYGVSYFSSKGPTGDGRAKPDLVAPGESIISCAAGAKGQQAAIYAGVDECHYREDSGTSMAAPHVSGAIAAFLSIRREFIGQPERVKEIFLDSCTDLGRERYFQGAGLLDLMRAIQSV